MTFLWGQLAFVQAWLLPGLAITLGRKELPLIDRLLLAFPLSALCNFLLAELLTLAGGYNRAAIIAVVIVEVALISWAMRRPSSPARVSPPKWTLQGWEDYLVVLVVGWVGLEILQIMRQDHVGSIFFDRDTIFSWNRWALDWANGRFPAHTWHYPQVVPVLISIPYVLLGDVRMEQFSMLITSAVPGIMLVTGVRMAVYCGSRRNVVALGVGLGVGLFLHLLGRSLPFGGTADVPVSYMAVASVYALVLAWHGRTLPTHPVLLLLAALVYAGAFATKQSAVATLGMPLLWAWYRREEGAPSATILRELVLLGSVVFVFAGHWYIYKEIQIQMGLAVSEIADITAQVQQPWWHKLARGWRMVWGAEAPLARGVILSAVAAMAAFDRVGRQVLFLGVLPVFFLWALLVSYDVRNFSVGVMPLGAALAFGALTTVRLIRGMVHAVRASRTGRRAAITVAALLVMALEVAAARRVTESRLLTHALEQKMSTGDRPLNEYLYEALPQLPPGAKVGTAYQFLGHLPGLQERYTLIHCENPAQLSHAVQVQKIAYLLWYRTACPDSLNALYIDAIRAGALRVLGAAGQGTLLEVQSPEHPVLNRRQRTSAP